jgi:hypothetical protein
MTSKQLSSLLRKAPPATATNAEPDPSTRSHKTREKLPEAIIPAPPPTEEMLLHVMVPAHVRRQVDVMAAQQGVKLRTLVLRGLRELGIEVSDEEIKGGHRRRRRM